MGLLQFYDIPAYMEYLALPSAPLGADNFETNGDGKYVTEPGEIFCRFFCPINNTQCGAKVQNVSSLCTHIKKHRTDPENNTQYADVAKSLWTCRGATEKRLCAQEFYQRIMNGHRSATRERQRLNGELNPAPASPEEGTFIIPTWGQATKKAGKIHISKMHQKLRETPGLDDSCVACRLQGSNLCHFLPKGRSRENLLAQRTCLNRIWFKQSDWDAIEAGGEVALPAEENEDEEADEPDEPPADERPTRKRKAAPAKGPTAKKPKTSKKGGGKGGKGGKKGGGRGGGAAGTGSSAGEPIPV